MADELLKYLGIGGFGGRTIIIMERSGTEVSNYKLKPDPYVESRVESRVEPIWDKKYTDNHYTDNYKTNRENTIPKVNLTTWDKKDTSGFYIDKIPTKINHNFEDNTSYVPIETPNNFYKPEDNYAFFSNDYNTPYESSKRTDFHYNEVKKRQRYYEETSTITSDQPPVKK